MSDAFRVLLEHVIETVPVAMSVTSLMVHDAQPFVVLGGHIRLYRLPSGEWYKPNGLGRYVLIDYKLHTDLDAMVRRRGLRTAYNKPFYPWKKIRVEFT